MLEFPPPRNPSLASLQQTIPQADKALVHAGEKPFSCPHGRQKFIQWSNYRNQHVRSPQGREALNRQRCGEEVRERAGHS